MAGGIRWISSMNSTSCACRSVSIAGQVARLLDDRPGGGLAPGTPISAPIT